MIYKTLPKLGGGWSHLPHLRFVPTPAMSPRFGMPIRKVWLHRWAPADEYENIVRYFQNPHNEASAHFVFPGSRRSRTRSHRWCRVPASRGPRRRSTAPASRSSAATRSGWATTRRGSRSLRVSRRSSSAPRGATGRMGKGRRVRSAPRVLPSRRRRALAGGHPLCPTTDYALWRQFLGRVQAETHRGEFRHGTAATTSEGAA
jgi:hypothetical protein